MVGVLHVRHGHGGVRHAVIDDRVHRDGHAVPREHLQGTGARAPISLIGRTQTRSTRPPLTSCGGMSNTPVRKSTFVYVSMHGKMKKIPGETRAFKRDAPT